jgi:hypothetical protein
MSIGAALLRVAGRALHYLVHVHQIVNLAVRVRRRIHVRLSVCLALLGACPSNRQSAHMATH